MKEVIIITILLVAVLVSGCVEMPEQKQSIMPAEVQTPPNVSIQTPMLTVAVTSVPTQRVYIPKITITPEMTPEPKSVKPSIP